MDDDDVLAGVPDDAEIQEESALLDDMDAEAQDEAAQDRATEVAEAGRFTGKKKHGSHETDEDNTGDAPSSLPKKVGKRRIIQHSLADVLPLVAIGINPDSAEEKAKRETRVAKFGGVAEAAPQHSEEERARREERAAKFGLHASVSAAEKATEGLVAPTSPVVAEAAEIALLTVEELRHREERAQKWGTQPRNPLESIVSAAPKGSFWEKRRGDTLRTLPLPLPSTLPYPSP